MGLIWELIKAIASSDNNSNDKEKEMDYYGLEEHEREEVRNGNYEPYNFEDSEGVELDDDDYYSEK